MNKKRKIIYVHETESFSENNGELIISGENFDIIWNCETLFTDLPLIMELVLESREKTDQSVKEQLKKLSNVK